MCRVCFHRATMGKSNQKIGKTQSVFEKFTQLVATEGIGDCKKKLKNSKSKITTLTYFDNLKKSSKIKVVKTGATLFTVLCHWQSQISELLHSVLKILSF